MVFFFKRGPFGAVGEKRKKLKIFKIRSFFHKNKGPEKVFFFPFSEKAKSKKKRFWDTFEKKI